MVDRLEELLAQVTDEDEGEQEDALALGTVPAAPAPEMEGQPEGWPETESRKGQVGREAAPAEHGATPPPAGQELPRAAGIQTSGGYPMEDSGRLENSKSNPAALRVLRAGSGQAEELLRPRKAAAGVDTEPESTPGAAAEQGLEELYRRTAQASRSASQTLPVEQAGRTVRAEGSRQIAALTVDELDRAVRRDSRRYDGGMSIF